MAEEGIFANLYKTLSSIAPTGINPITFFSIFIIIFAVVFSILRKMELFKSDGKENKGAMAVIALVFALVVAVSPDVSKVVSLTLPGTGIVMIVVLLVLFTLALISPSPEKFTKSLPLKGSLIIIVVLVIMIYMFLSASNVEESTDLLTTFGTGIMTFTPKDVSLIIIGLFVIGFLLIIWSAFKKGAWDSKKAPVKPADKSS